MHLTRWSVYFALLAALCAPAADLRRVEYVGKTKYLNNAWTCPLN